MPKIDINGRPIHYTVTGSGSETIMFSHGYLMSHEMFAAQIEALGKDYRVIAYDHRGHGESGACHEAFGMYELVDDAAQLIEALDEGPVHFAGMSTGGYVGMRLLLKHPDLIRRLILIDTSATAEPPATLKKYNQLLFIVRLIGIRPLLGKVLPLIFGRSFLNDPSRKSDYIRWKNYIGSLKRRSIRPFGRAIFDRDDVLEKLSAIENPAPTLILVGEEDIPTPPAEAQAMHTAIKGSRLVQVPQAGHSSPIEQPEAVTQAIAAFLTDEA